MSPIQQNKSVEVEIGPDGSGSVEIDAPAQGLSRVIAEAPDAIVSVVPIDGETRARVDVANCSPDTTTFVHYFDAALGSPPAAASPQGARVGEKQFGATTEPMDPDAEVAPSHEGHGDAPEPVKEGEHGRKRSGK